MAQKPSILPLEIWYQILSWATDSRRTGTAQHGRFSADANGDTFEAKCEGGRVTITRTPNTKEIGRLYNQHTYLQQKKASLPSATNTPFDFEDDADRERILKMIEGAESERAGLEETEQGLNVLIRSLAEEPEIMEIDVSEILATGFVAVIACPQKKRAPVPLYPDPLPEQKAKPEPEKPVALEVVETGAQSVPEGEPVLPENFTPVPPGEVPVMFTAPVAEEEPAVVTEGGPDPESEPVESEVPVS